MKPVDVEQASLLLQLLFLNKAVCSEESTELVSSCLDIERGEVDKPVCFCCFLDFVRIYIGIYQASRDLLFYGAFTRPIWPRKHA